MITEDYVSYEVAKLLKEKGFDECPLFRYDDCGELWVQGGYNKTIKWHFPAPTLQMAMKWLREACGLTISIEFQAICPTWKWRIYINSSNKKHTDFQHYNKYEKSVDAALKYALKNLI